MVRRQSEYLICTDIAQNTTSQNHRQGISALPVQLSLIFTHTTLFRYLNFFLMSSRYLLHTSRYLLNIFSISSRYLLNTSRIFSISSQYLLHTFRHLLNILSIYSPYPLDILSISSQYPPNTSSRAPSSSPIPPESPSPNRIPSQSDNSL